MTYVTDQTSSELRSHMRWLTSLAGWHEPLADRLWKDVQNQDTELRRLHEVNLGLIELAEALNDALTEVYSRNANLEISDKHDERIKVASAKLKEQK
jgi:hypothetical protein